LTDERVDKTHDDMHRITYRYHVSSMNLHSDKLESTILFVIKARRSKKAKQSIF